MPTPNDPIRERIVDDLADTLQAITAGAAYWYTPANVFKWRMPPPEAIAFPAMCVLDTDERVERATTPLAHRTLSVTIVGIHSADLIGQSDRVARRLLADIQKRVQVDRTRGGLAVTTNEVANRIFVESPSEPVVVVEVDLEITYRTALGDPASTAP